MVLYFHSRKYLYCTLLKREHELFCIELYVNVIENVGSFS